MNFEELGLTLKREREKKGLSIEVVMEATKISRTNIVAMENGDRSTLPHPVYTKGFVKSYARFLGLDADEMSMIVDREYQDEADGPEEQIYEVSPAAERAFQEGDSPEAKKKSIVPFLFAFALLAGVVVLLVMNLGGTDEGDKAEPEAVVEKSQEVDQPAPPALVESEATEDETQTENQEAQTDETARPAQNAVEETSVEPAKEEGKPQPEPARKVEEKQEAVVPLPEKKAEDKQEKQQFDHELVIRATTDKGCWIGVWRGEEANMARDFVLKQGEPLRLKFNTPRRVRIGNASGVSVMYNGKPYPLDSAKGNIQTLRFGME